MHNDNEQIPGFEAFKANDENLETAWKASSSTNEWIEIEWLKPHDFNLIKITESGNNIIHYKIQYLKENEWMDLAKDTTIGKEKEHRFETISTAKCRMLITEAKDKPIIAEFELYLKPSK